MFFRDLSAERVKALEEENERLRKEIERLRAKAKEKNNNCACYRNNLRGEIECKSKSTS